MSDQFRAAVTAFNAEINKQKSLKTLTLALSEDGIKSLTITSDHGMSVKKWLEINYPDVKITQSANGFTYAIEA